jgi:hypothetical protein
MLAYAVGFGGSMIWFGSSAGVALSNSFPEARSVGAWLRHGWHVAVAYILGFLVLLAVVGWQPGTTREAPVPTPPRDHASIPNGAAARVLPVELETSALKISGDDDETQGSGYSRGFRRND